MHNVLVQLVKVKALGDMKLSFILLEIIKVMNDYYIQDLNKCAKIYEQRFLAW